MTSSGLDRYLRRIGYSGPLTPTLETVNAIVAHHTRSIPFENLDPFRGVPNKLDLPSLYAKLVDGGRGGYCYEQNLLLADILSQLGFTFDRLAARVVWGLPEDEVRARTHMLLLVDVEGTRRVVDVGFGGMMLTGTLVLDTAEPQQTPLEPFCLVQRPTPTGVEYIQQALVNDEWLPIYRFDLHPQLPVDYVPTNWYLSTSPDSHFVTGLLAARAESDRRYALRDLRFTVHHFGGDSQRRMLASAGELREVLEEHLHIATGGIDVDDVYARLTS
ncbi:MAG: arylamine N-acetyltransferase [Rhodococcus sp.]|nr:arylamine N-acetyltransferase [Rhodococcus sp. (in: high G+C Gram-positive bacteria)]